MLAHAGRVQAQALPDVPASTGFRDRVARVRRLADGPRPATVPFCRTKDVGPGSAVVPSSAGFHRLVPVPPASPRSSGRVSQPRRAASRPPRGPFWTDSQIVAALSSTDGHVGQALLTLRSDCYTPLMHRKALQDRKLLKPSRVTHGEQRKRRLRGLFKASAALVANTFVR